MQLEKGDILLKQGLNEMLELAMDRNAEREKKKRCCGGQEEERSGNIIACLIQLSVAARHFQHFFAMFIHTIIYSINMTSK